MKATLTNGIQIEGTSKEIREFFQLEEETEPEQIKEEQITPEYIQNQNQETSRKIKKHYKKRKKMTWYYKMKRRGICTNCGKNKAGPGTMCYVCRAKVQEKQKQRKQMIPEDKTERKRQYMRDYMKKRRKQNGITNKRAYFTQEQKEIRRKRRRLINLLASQYSIDHKVPYQDALKEVWRQTKV